MKNHCITIKGMSFYAHHGYYREEQTIGGSYVVDADLFVDLSPASVSDDLQHSLNYEEVYLVVKAVMNERYHLIEKVAGRILEDLWQAFPMVDRAIIRVAKVKPPIKGQVQEVSVTLDELRPANT